MPENLKVKIKAGADRVKHWPVFSYDSKYLLIPSGNHIKVLSTATGECVRNLIGHKSTVVSVQQNPKVQIQIISCSEDGRVIAWDYEDGTIVKIYELNLDTPIFAFYIPCKESPWFVIIKEKNEDFHRLFSVSFEGNKVKKRFLLKPVLPKQNCVSFGNQAEFVAGIYKNEMSIFHISKNIFKKHITGTRKLTCVVCHPTDTILATGDETGQVLLWANFLKSNHPTKSIYHWHTLPVEDIMFSSEGSYLYSGGGECVLVKWKVGTENRHFLPRMGYPICHITVSSNNLFVATSHVDNATYLINAQSKIVQVFQGMTQSCLLGMKLECDLPILLYDPRSRALVLNGKPGQLQFYDPNEDLHYFSIDVVGENYLSRERNKVIANTDVDKAAFDHQGIWLATLEYRDDKETSPSIKLKFWKFTAETQRYVLNTTVHLPHKKKVCAVKFRPPTDSNVPMVVTVGTDKMYKLWYLISRPGEDVIKESWNCLSVGYYHDLNANDGCFSEDGSTLAVAFDYIVSLWNPDTNALLNNLHDANSEDSICQVMFGQQSCCHLLVCSTKSNLIVWNVLNLTIMWKAEVQISNLSSDPQSDVMAAFSTEKMLFVFRPDNPEPLYTHRNVSEKQVICSLFVPHKRSQNEGWQKNSQLYYMNEDQELMVLTEETEDEETPSNLVRQRKFGPMTPFAKLIAEYQCKDPIKLSITKYDSEGILGVKEFLEIMDVPSHVMPPARLLCSKFLSSMILPSKWNSSKEGDIRSHADKKSKQKNQNNEAKDQSKSEEQVPMDIDGQNMCENLRLKCVLQENYDWLLND